LRNQDGYVVYREEYRVYDQKFYFPSPYAGHFGEIIFTKDNGLKYVYDIQTGNVMTYLNIEADSDKINVGIKNYKEYTLTGGSYFEELIFSRDSDVGKEMETPIYRMKVTNQSSLTIFSYNYYVEDGQFYIEIPTVIVEDIETGEETSFGLGGTFSFDLLPGDYMIRLVFTHLEEPEAPYYYYYGEKG
jgi:hypothetical protein